MTTKDQVLRMLMAGTEVSGEMLARELGLSRNAVWKAIQALRLQGYKVEAGTNRGYRLVSSPDLLAEAEIRRWMKASVFGRRMEIYDRLDSTNNRAKVLAAEGAPHGQMVIADSQSGGRGRLGRSFFSPERAGIYLSYVLRPTCSPERAAMLTSLAAAAVADAIDTLAGTEVRIKWVNDLYLGGKKICGILSEAGMGMEAGQLDYVVVGIGVNVRPMEFPPELRDAATSIGNETGIVLNRNRLIAEITDQMERMYSGLETGEFLRENRRRSNVIGREVLVLEGGKQYPAFAENIDDQGRLVIRTDAGKAALGYGEVSLKL